MVFIQNCKLKIILIVTITIKSRKIIGKIFKTKSNKKKYNNIFNWLFWWIKFISTHPDQMLKFYQFFMIINHNKLINKYYISFSCILE